MRFGMMAAVGLLAVANASMAQVATKSGNSQTVRAIGICQIIENTPGWPAGELRVPNTLEPIASVDIYFYQRARINLNRAEGTVTILQPPKVGTLKPIEGLAGGYEYIPSSTTHEGKDSASFFVEIGGHKVKVMYVFHVMTAGAGDGPEFDRKICGPRGTMWKISQ